MRRGTVASSAKRSSRMSAAGFTALQRESWRTVERPARHSAAEASICATSASSSASACSGSPSCVAGFSSHNALQSPYRSRQAGLLHFRVSASVLTLRLLTEQEHT